MEAEGRGRGRDTHFFSPPLHIVASLSSSKRWDPHILLSHTEGGGGGGDGGRGQRAEAEGRG